MTGPFCPCSPFMYSKCMCSLYFAVTGQAWLNSAHRLCTSSVSQEDEPWVNRGKVGQTSRCCVPSSFLWKSDSRGGKDPSACHTGFLSSSVSLGISFTSHTAFISTDVSLTQWLQVCCTFCVHFDRTSPFSLIETGLSHFLLSGDCRWLGVLHTYEGSVVTGAAQTHFLV